MQDPAQGVIGSRKKSKAHYLFQVAHSLVGKETAIHPTASQKEKLPM